MDYLGLDVVMKVSLAVLIDYDFRISYGDKVVQKIYQMTTRNQNTKEGNNYLITKYLRPKTNIYSK